MDTKFDFISNGHGTCCITGIASSCLDKDIIIPSTSPAGDTVTSISEWAFSNCSSLTSITIPDGVTKIGSKAFAGCINLTSVKIPNSVKTIGAYAFQLCKSLTSITIPDTVFYIGDGAFCGCSVLTSLNIPNNVASISFNTFSYCYSLTNITIPSGVTSIGGGAFYLCESLTSITIPHGVTSIGDGAFYGCISLKSITIPEGIELIGSRAFSGCESLKNYSTRRFKATNKEMQCRNFQYKMDTWYEESDAQLCRAGFHSCASPLDVLNYYFGIIGENVRFFEVETQEESSDHKEDSKHVAKRIRFINELTLSELAYLASNEE